MDLTKQIEYWRQSSEEDWEVARFLLTNGRIRHSLFLAHLSLEKMLKALVVKETKAIPPKIHKLERLAELAGVSLSTEQKRFLAEFGAYQLIGRYPDQAQVKIDPETARKDFAEAEEIIKWLKNQLLKS
jgi:HEPN domain-containing protein